MDIEAALRAHLLADAGVSGIVGVRVYPITMPEARTLPAITYQRVAGPRVGAKDGPAGLAYPTIQVDCWAASYGDAKRLATAVRMALDGFRGVMGGAAGVGVSRAELESDEDLYEEDTGLYRVRQDWTIWHEEATA